MWTVLKFDKKKIKDLKAIFQKKLGSSPVFYIPKIKIQRFFKNQAKDYEFDVLGNYAFCYHEKIADAKIYPLLNNTIGLKYFLGGFSFCQDQITDFIKKCKSHEDKSGFLTQSFFQIKNNSDFQFISGPFNNFFFQLIEERKKKYVITLNSFKINISKDKTLFRTV